MQPGVGIADNARRSLEAIQLPPGYSVNALKVPLERAVKDHVAARRQDTAPSRERLRVRPYDLTGARVPRGEQAEMGSTRGRVHVQSRADVGGPSCIGDPERLVIHAYMVARDVEQTGTRRKSGRCLVLGAKGRWANTGAVNVLAVELGRVSIHHLRTAGPHIDMGCPVDGRVEFFCH